MKIKLSNCDFYYLTNRNPTRKQNILSQFCKFPQTSLTEVNPAKMTDLNKKQSGGTGFSRMIDTACQKQDPKGTFKPFVLLEDDVSLSRSLEELEQVDIPDDADLLYLGLSSFGLTKVTIDNGKGIKYKAKSGKVCFSHVNNDVVRIYNMLSLHAILVCSFYGALTFQKCLIEDFYKRRHYDWGIAQQQPYFKVYALRNPIFYQDKKVGGQEDATKIKFEKTEENMNKLLSWKITENLAIKTCVK